MRASSVVAGKECYLYITPSRGVIKEAVYEEGWLSSNVVAAVNALKE